MIEDVAQHYCEYLKKTDLNKLGFLSTDLKSFTAILWTPLPKKDTWVIDPPPVGADTDSRPDVVRDY